MIKVADFGLSESIDTTKDYFRQDQDNAIKLPIKWLAPESINDGVFSEKSDVVIMYIFGSSPPGSHLKGGFIYGSHRPDCLEKVLVAPATRK